MKKLIFKVGLLCVVLLGLTGTSLAQSFSVLRIMERTADACYGFTCNPEKDKIFQISQNWRGLCCNNPYDLGYYLGNGYLDILETTTYHFKLVFFIFVPWIWTLYL